jgi:hypothetical protein
VFRVRVFRTSIGQLSFNLNFLADKAVGEFLIRMDADDVSYLTRFEKMNDFLNNASKSYDVVGSSFHFIDKSGRVISQAKMPTTESDVRIKLIFGSPFCHPTVMLRRTWLLSIRGYSGSFVSEDKDLWIRAVRAKAKMINVPDVLLGYRVHSNQASRSVLGYVDSVIYWMRAIFDYRDIGYLCYSMAGFGISILKLLLISFINLYNKIRFGLR